MWGVLASGLGRRSSSHYSPTDSPNSPSLLVRRQFAFPILAVLAVAALGLWLLLPGGALRAQDPTIEFPENSKDPVATFTAVDPEGVTPVTWAVANSAQISDEDDLEDADNADAADFTIDKDGVLKFDIDRTQDGSSPGSPDFENGQGSGTGNNTYKVVVIACDVALNTDDECPAPTTGEAGYHKVTVKVTEVAETGKVTWTVDPDGTGVLDANVPPAKPIVQFQVGAVLTVPTANGVTDGDVSGDDKNVTERFQWYRSPSKTATGTAIDGETTNTYTTTTEDVDMYIRVEAFYNISPTAREESASRTSDYPVLASRTNNKVPEFDPDEISRSVAEGKKGMTVGALVTATDDITNALSYSLGGADVARFKIDQKTGQITTAVDLNREGTAVATATTLGSCADATPSDGADTECVVTVTATDSAGDSADATVTIKITNVDEKPKFTDEATALSPMTIMSPEKSTALFATGRETSAGFVAEAAGVTYAAMDPDGGNVTWSLMGADGAKFQLSGTRLLSFNTKPDYEVPTDANRDNVYEVTVRASDGTMHADRMVKVTVTDVDDAPVITGKDSVTFKENSKDPVATFTAVDPEGVTPVTWAVANSAQISDEDDLEDADNADAADFTIDKDGVLKFDIDRTQDGSSPGSPDFENGQGSGTGNNTYKVVVIACDVALNTDDECPAPTTGEAGYHKVTVKVTEVAETGKVTWTVDPDGTGVLDANVPPAKPIVQFQVGAVLTVPTANGVTDGDVSGDDKNVNETLQWYRSSSKIDGETTNAYTTTTDDIGKTIRVVASYNIGTGPTVDASRTSDYPVLASRSDNEAPEFDPASVKREVSEGKKGMNVGARVTATDDITNALSYSLGGADVARFKIDQKTGQITTAVDLNREGTAVATATTLGSCADATPSDGADTECVVTVTATDSAGDSADATVTIKITNVDEKPKFTDEATALSPMTIMSPEKSTALFATGRETSAGFVAEATGVSYAATDPEGLNVNLTLMGPDGTKFELSDAGVLSFMAKPDYENPGDRDKDNVYEVTVRASDGTVYADRMVEVTVTEVDEAPVITRGGLSISGPSSVSHPEDSATTTVGTYTARGENPAGARWTLDGDDRLDFRLSASSGASVMLMFRSAPDYERPVDMGEDNVYMVTLKATEGSNTDTHDVTVRVNDVVEDVPVIGDDTLLGKFDDNENGQIDKSEVVDAIIAFVTPGASDKPSKEDIVDLIVHFVTTPR